MDQSPAHPEFPRLAPGLAINQVTNAVMDFGTHPRAGAQAHALHLLRVDRNLDFRRNPYMHNHINRLRDWTPSSFQQQYMEASMVQTMGTTVVDRNSGKEVECTRCSNLPHEGPQGPFTSCRVMLGNRPDGQRWLLGACANCYYHRKGRQCSFRNPTVGDGPPSPVKPADGNGPGDEGDDDDDGGPSTGGGGDKACESKTEVKNESAIKQAPKAREFLQVFKPDSPDLTSCRDTSIIQPRIVMNKNQSAIIVLLRSEDDDAWNDIDVDVYGSLDEKSRAGWSRSSPLMPRWIEVLASLTPDLYKFPLTQIVANISFSDPTPRPKLEKLQLHDPNLKTRNSDIGCEESQFRNGLGLKVMECASHKNAVLFPESRVLHAIYLLAAKIATPTSGGIYGSKVVQAVSQ
ncbi:hypothetical protein VTL71DRAFT_1231 [Oculimacula yallundae]|uniref:Uncharacterized protein n=1 Tax=Oculimacula yallundae TaxID=86028 RepID=A0ABR4CAW2_9HELO